MERIVHYTLSCGSDDVYDALATRIAKLYSQEKVILTQPFPENLSFEIYCPKRFDDLDLFIRKHEIEKGTSDIGWARITLDHIGIFNSGTYDEEFYPDAFTHESFMPPGIAKNVEGLVGLYAKHSEVTGKRTYRVEQVRWRYDGPKIGEVKGKFLTMQVELIGRAVPLFKQVEKAHFLRYPLEGLEVVDSRYLLP